MQPVNEHDGLQHWPDGQKIYKPDHQKIGGVNNYEKATHRLSQGEAVVHQDVDVETLDEKESHKKEIE